MQRVGGGEGRKERSKIKAARFLAQHVQGSCLIPSVVEMYKQSLFSYYFVGLFESKVSCNLLKLEINTCARIFKKHFFLSFETRSHCITLAGLVLCRPGWP